MREGTPADRAGRCLFSKGLLLLSHHVCPPFSSWLALQCKHWALSSFTLGSVARERKCVQWQLSEHQCPGTENLVSEMAIFVISGGLRKSVYYSTEVFLPSVSSGICVMWQQDKVEAPFTDLGFVYGNSALEVWITRFWRLALGHQVAQISTTMVEPACSLPLEKFQLLADCNARAESSTLQWGVHTTAVFLLRFFWLHSDWIVRFTGFQKAPHRPHFRMGDILGIPKPWIISRGREIRL